MFNLQTVLSQAVMNYYQQTAGAMNNYQQPSYAHVAARSNSMLWQQRQTALQQQQQQQPPRQKPQVTPQQNNNNSSNVQGRLGPATRTPITAPSKDGPPSASNRPVLLRQGQQDRNKPGKFKLI